MQEHLNICYNDALRLEAQLGFMLVVNKQKLSKYESLQMAVESVVTQAVALKNTIELLRQRCSELDLDELPF